MMGGYIIALHMLLAWPALAMRQSVAIMQQMGPSEGGTPCGGMPSAPFNLCVDNKNRFDDYKAK